MGGAKGQFPQPFRNMGCLHSQAHLTHDPFRWMLHADFQRLGLKAARKPFTARTFPSDTSNQAGTLNYFTPDVELGIDSKRGNRAE